MSGVPHPSSVPSDDSMAYDYDSSDDESSSYWDFRNLDRRGLVSLDYSQEFPGSFENQYTTVHGTAIGDPDTKEALAYLLNLYLMKPTISHSLFADWDNPDVLIANVINTFTADMWSEATVSWTLHNNPLFPNLTSVEAACAFLPRFIVRTRHPPQLGPITYQETVINRHDFIQSMRYLQYCYSSRVGPNATAPSEEGWGQWRSLHRTHDIDSEDDTELRSTPPLEGGGDVRPYDAALQVVKFDAEIERLLEMKKKLLENAETANMYLEFKQEKQCSVCYEMTLGRYKCGHRICEKCRERWKTACGVGPESCTVCRTIQAKFCLLSM
jgi:hypothetical protein